MATTYPAAYAFESPLSLADMHQALQAAGPWPWELRESDSYGDYVGAWPDDGPTKLRVIRQDPGFLLDVLYLSRSTRNRHTRAEIEQVIQDKVLPAVQAQNVRPAPGL